MVARLHVQISELVKGTTLDESGREAIFSASVHASLRLIHCWEIQKKLAEECEKLELEFQPPQNDQIAATIPSVSGLRHEAENFLYEAKNYLRDLTDVINAAYSTSFNQASHFHNQIPQWAVGEFGTEDPLTKFLSSHRGWISEVNRMRNTVEHPNGRDGVITITNYQMVPNLGILRPAWQRTGKQQSFIVSDMAALCDVMLRFGEELIVIIIEKRLHSPMIQIYEIPVDERNSICPKRFVLGFAGIPGHP